MNRHDLYDLAFVSQFPIAEQAFTAPSGGGRDLVLALRCSLQKPTYGSPPPAPTFLLGQALLGTNRSLTEAQTAYSVLRVVPTGVNLVPSLLTGLVALALFLTVRDHREYLMLAIFCFCGAANSLGELISWLMPFNLAQSFIGFALQLPLFLALFAFLQAMLPRRHSRFFVVLAILVAIDQTVGPLWAAGLVPWAASNIHAVVAVIYTALVVLLWRSRKGATPAVRQDLTYLVLGLVLEDFSVLNQVVLSVLTSLFGKHAIYLSKFAYITRLNIGPFSFQATNLPDLGFTLCLLLLLVSRTVRIARERNRAAAEIEAAQSVQKPLLSHSAVASPRFRVDTVYRPANEVGGDFFLISPDQEDGSLVAIVGDVSGKGLTAAMHVSMILGVLRRETSRAPHAILANLNDALVAQGATGFTTACCVHFQPTGSYVLANAGHIAPYLEGIELETAGSLPLGLAPDQVYTTVSGRMPPDQRMVLLSDGVPEARSKTGDLYGFQRLATLTLRSAMSIADAAQSFGQEDDITVVSIALVA